MMVASVADIVASAVVTSAAVLVVAFAATVPEADYMNNFVVSFV